MAEVSPAPLTKEATAAQPKKAGISGQKFAPSVSDDGFPGAINAGAIYKESAKKAGIEIDLVRETAH